uniref:Uncharacterized protein n=1 Tax=Sus scrofa TaxID=9823 RepID=A0A4X1VFZ7_PIG
IFHPADVPSLRAENIASSGAQGVLESSLSPAPVYSWEIEAERGVKVSSGSFGGLMWPPLPLPRALASANL